MKKVKLRVEHGKSGYAMFKRDEAHTTQSPAPRRVSAKERTTFGVFLEPRLTDNWDLELEAAQQVGRIVDSGRFAGGTMAHAAVNYRMDALRTYRPTLTWATTYYSGDSDRTKDGAADRAWDPVWARYTQDSEMLVYGSLYENCRWTNLIYSKLRFSMAFGPHHALYVYTGPMFAAVPDGLGHADGEDGYPNKGTIGLVRRAGKKYAIDYVALPAADAAKYTRSVPKEFIAKNGHDVTPAFLAYAKPLVGDLPPCEVL